MRKTVLAALAAGICTFAAAAADATIFTTISGAGGNAFHVSTLPEHVYFLATPVTAAPATFTLRFDGLVGGDVRSCATAPPAAQAACNTPHLPYDYASTFTITGLEGLDFRQPIFLGLTADLTLTISATNGPAVNLLFTNITAAAVPEPAAWAMAIGGLSLVGATMRRARARIAFA